MNPLALTVKIVALAILFQALELFALRSVMSEAGVWRWSTLRREFRIFPDWFQRFLGVVLAYPNVLGVLAIQIVSAVLLFSVPDLLWLSPILLVGAMLTSLRWRGTFNGGSDYMTIVVLTGLTIAALAPGNVTATLACFWYLALQAVASYFLAGLVKLRQRDWRAGIALPVFVRSASYPVPQFFLRCLESKVVASMLSWGVIAFECSFPLALLWPTAAQVYIAAAIIFHLVNVFIFGLNRFVFAWAATYPALYFCSTLSQ